MMTPSPLQRIAVLMYRYIGDTLLTIPFLRQLRKQYPAAQIDFWTGPVEQPLMATCPYIHQAIAFDPKAIGFTQAVSLLKAGHYDRVYILKRSFSSALLAFAAGIPQRIGFNTEHRGLLLTQRIPYHPKEKHEAACFFDLLGHTAPENTLYIENWLDAAFSESIWRRLSLPDYRPAIVLSATSTNTSKCWPIASFQSLAENLIKSYGAILYALGTPADKAVYTPLQAALPASCQHQFYNLCGQTTLVESVALLKKMDLVVANDSGLIHLAAAANVPIVGLYGPTRPEQWRPLTKHVTIVKADTSTSLSEIQPERVLAACKPYLTS